MIDISLLWNHSPSEWFSMHKNPGLHKAGREFSFWYFVYRRASVKPFPFTSSTWDTITNAVGSIPLMQARKAGSLR